MNTDNSLALWRLLIGASLRDHCQTALLTVPQTSSYTFDADPTATSADLDALEQGVSLLLSVQFPAAKVMGRDDHVGVEVVSSATNCCGIFNVKEVRVRMDPVVRMCGLPPKGKGGCTNTSHANYPLAFKGERLLIQTPTVSKATTRAFFSLPYLKVEELPPSAVPVLTSLKAPANVWRTFIGDTPTVLQQLRGEGVNLPLQVVASRDSDSTKSQERVEAQALPSLQGKDDERKDDAGFGDDGCDDDKASIVDYLDSDLQDDLIGKSARKLGARMGSGDYNIDTHFESDVLGLADLNLEKNTNSGSVTMIGRRVNRIGK
ncbi:hypothetical protein ACHAWO_006728 [Cyclotella atomus]|uniref:Uncharacterized protein n=1 Tax=Cyclotella atomus TaxID=382360 RepID=A0ABD3MWN9_9STRA